MKYGLKEYKELLEKALQSYEDPCNVPVDMWPHDYAARVYRKAKQEALVYALEMLPEIDDDEKGYDRGYSDAIGACQDAIESLGY